LLNKQLSGLIIAFFLILGILGVLASIAIPHAREMAYDQQVREQEEELLQIRSAVTEMLQVSPGGRLESIGPVKDMNLVKTADTQPLILTDYLPEDLQKPIDSGYVYSFTADGFVLQTAVQ